ncbi:putative reverse transcriptase zinc-binding domain-containing protein [Helianthus annuus]|nr:putative reverse transcriptase zinc-binding domain-containing protein [Helianthus annuus]
MGHPKSWKELNCDFIAAQECVDDKFIWTYTSPMLPVSQVNFLGRRLFLRRLPTRVVLQRREIAVQDVRCPLCGDLDETADHVFISCRFAQIVWQFMADWCRLHSFILFDRLNLFNYHSFANGLQVEENNPNTDT